MKLSTKQSIELAKLAVDYGVIIGSQSNSPVDCMTRAFTAVEWNFTILAQLDESEQIEQLGAMLENPLEDTSTDINMGAVVNDISASVNGHIDYAKNTVVPLVTEYTNRVMAYIERPDSLVSKFNIIIKDLPEVMRDASFKDSVLQNAGGLFAEPDAPVVIPHTGPGFITDNLMTGSSDYDSMIRKWSAGLGDTQLVKMWENVYGRSSNKVTDLLADSANGVDYALFTYLSSRRLFDEVPEGVQLNISDYKRLITQYREMSSKRLEGIYAGHDLTVKAGLVVTYANADSMEVRVNGDVYRDYLKQGGKNEVIIGSVFAGGVVKTMGELVNKSDEFYQLYQRQEAVNDAIRRVQATNTFRVALKNCFVDLLASPSNQELDARNTFSMNATSMAKDAQNAIDALSSEELKNVAQSCLLVMCRARFPYTDAEKFLTAMNEASVANPAIDPREAALIATIELISDYVCAQLTKTNV